MAIACSNLATLLLVRGAARAKDVSVRLALGATRKQLVRHLLMESLLLAAAGGIAGCILAWWTIRALGAIDLPIVLDLTLDYRVLIFAIALSLVTGVAFGLAPSLKATRIDLVPTLRDNGETRLSDLRWFTLKNALVVFRRRVGRAARRNEHRLSDAERVTIATSGLCSRRRGDARNGSALCALRR